MSWIPGLIIIIAISWIIAEIIDPKGGGNTQL